MERNNIGGKKIFGTQEEKVERGEKILYEIFRSQLFGVPMRFQARTGVRARPLCFSGCKGRKNKTVN